VSIQKILRRFVLCLVLGGRSIWGAHTSREQIEELLDVANRPRAEVVITQKEDATDSSSDVATGSWEKYTIRKSNTGEQE
jgi:hypothetical protein